MGEPIYPKRRVNNRGRNGHSHGGGHSTQRRSNRSYSRSNNGGYRRYNGMLESNGPQIKVKGSARQIHDKYIQLARDARGNDDRVLMENYHQHADHYYRLFAEDDGDTNTDINANARMDSDAEIDDENEAEIIQDAEISETSDEPDNAPNYDQESIEAGFDPTTGLPAHYSRGDVEPTQAAEKKASTKLTQRRFALPKKSRRNGDETADISADEKPTKTVRKPRAKRTVSRDDEDYDSNPSSPV